MEHIQARAGFTLLVVLVLSAVLSACGSPEHDNTVPVNLSLVVDPTQAAQPSPPVSPLMAFIQRWLIGGTDVWAQAVTDIRTIQVQILGPDIPVPPTTTVSVTNPTSGQVIPVSIQAPVGPNRTITVGAFNAANPPQKIFSGTLPGVNLTPGTPVNLTVTLARTITITVTKQGTGSGTVTSTPAGINCGATCSNQFDANTSVALNAAAAPGSSFVSWGGACSGNGPCTVTGNATVTATFNTAANTHHLTVNKSGTGTGTVTSNPSGISCGATCAADFPIGSTVVLNASPTGGSTFNGWSGGGCSGTGSCIVVMNADQTVTATFTAPANTFTLTVTKAGVGLGTVTSSPPGIDCGATCSFAFVSGTTVTLTATPSAGSTFAGWSGSGCSGTGTCVVVMSQNRSVTATFNAVPSVLTVTKAGTGTGTVTSSPSGINCGAGCSAASASFPTGSSVTLTATAASGSMFVGWSGGGCSGTGTCTTVMATNQTVVATFTIAPTLTVNKSGSGNGTVTSSPAGINCGNDCSQSYAQGTVVTLTATPNGNSNFTGWSAPCSGTGPCVITLVTNTTVGAQFTSK